MMEGSDAAASVSLDITAPFVIPGVLQGMAGLSLPSLKEHRASLLNRAAEGRDGKCQHQISLMGNSTLLQPQTPPRFPPAQGGFGVMG